MGVVVGIPAKEDHLHHLHGQVIIGPTQLRRLIGPTQLRRVYKADFDLAHFARSHIQSLTIHSLLYHVAFDYKII